MPKTKDLLTVTEVAAELGLSIERVRQLVYEGRLGAARIGFMWVIGRPELERFKKLPRRPGRPKEETP